MSQATLKQCGPYKLRQQHSNRYFHPQNWESEKCTRYMPLLMLKQPTFASAEHATMIWIKIVESMGTYKDQLGHTNLNVRSHHLLRQFQPTASAFIITLKHQPHLFFC